MRHSPRHAGPAAVHYCVTAPDVRTHLFHVTLTVIDPATAQTVMLPAWIPGSYLIREFAKHLQCLEASQNGQPCRIRQVDKHTWKVACQTGTPLVLRYQVYAHDASVRTAWLDGVRGFFNPACLCLQVQGQATRPHHLQVIAPDPAWALATGLNPLEIDERGFGTYTAPDYDTLADSPVETGTFWSADFEVMGIAHRFVITTPPPGFDAERLIHDTRRICMQAMRFWHGKRPQPHLPIQRYVFMLNAVHEGYGGLEHHNSTALVASRRCLPRPGQKDHPDYVSLLGLISHEYFHIWNVKRLRPADLLPYDYTRENFTELLWFFEGFTSYYDDLLLLRAGCIDLPTYLKQLDKSINNVMGTPGGAIQSVAQASFDAWTKYYRPDANTVNATVNYYTKGALIALCLDLTLRHEGHTTLDAVMQALYQRCYASQPRPRGMTESDLADVLQQLGGRSFARELRQWVHGTTRLPLEPLLTRHGITVRKITAPLHQQWGLRCTEGSSIVVQSVLRDGPAEKAGLAAGDEWLAVRLAGTDADASGHDSWRVGRLDDVQQLLPPAGRQPHAFTAVVARDRRIIGLPFTAATGSVQQWALHAPAKPAAAANMARDGARTARGWPWA